MFPELFSHSPSPSSTWPAPGALWGLHSRVSLLRGEEAIHSSHSTPSRHVNERSRSSKDRKNHETLKRNLMFYREARAARLCCSRFRLMIRGPFFKRKAYGDVSGKKAFCTSGEHATASAGHTGLSEGAYIPEPRYPQLHHCGVHSPHSINTEGTLYFCASV